VTLRSCILVLAAAVPIAAQTASWKGPVSGLVYDAPSQALRPLIGVPGGSYLGPAIAGGLEAAFIAPDGDLALVIKAAQPVLLSGLQGEIQELPLPDLGAPFDRVAWAGNSKTAIIYSSSNRQLTRLAIRDSLPVVEPVIDGTLPAGEVVCIATSDDGSRAVIALRHAESGGLYEIGTQSAVRIFPSPDPGVAVFARSGNALYAFDRDTRQVLRFPDVASGGWEYLRFAGESESLLDPVGIALSQDGRRLYMAGAADRVIRAYELATQSVIGETGIAVVPSGLVTIAATTGLFSISSRTKAGEPFWVFDSRISSAYFVPAGE